MPKKYTAIFLAITFFAGTIVSMASYALAGGLCSPFCFRVMLNPIPGYDDVVDAVTQASNILANIYVDVDRPSNPSDSIKVIRAEYGDGSSPRSWTPPLFPLDTGYVAITHWFVRNEQSDGICTLTVSASTFGGDTLDTCIVIRVLPVDVVQTNGNPKRYRALSNGSTMNRQDGVVSLDHNLSGQRIYRRVKGMVHEYYMLTGKLLNTGRQQRATRKDL